MLYFGPWREPGHYFFTEGGKIEYLCPRCKSGNIRPINMMSQKSGECADCNSWWPWSTRHKESLKAKGLPTATHDEVIKNHKWIASCFMFLVEESPRDCFMTIPEDERIVNG